ncbi:hemerythrin domain-containing protein [Nocardioides anomalus]|uniref:Hemerythrin domain-containing protein n=1 Tax=Nocardioides anomalus TaxID=2712223 RepID=A0A6G6W922_9ACTN|nr:hemerythrin domain-containing protein [Nocardioides anomalus]QIG41838.1 hemerythrin domain-containing protein [Nocardioides anomalus]
METNAPMTTDADLVDVRDMLVVHTALLREFRLAPAAVRRVAHDDRRQAFAVERHLDLVCGLMHHHHVGEDELLWPVLSPRLDARATPLLDVAEAQHAGIEAALDRVSGARLSWLGGADDASREELADALSRLHALLAEHLEHEERHLLPLAAAHLSEAEWHAIGDAGARSVPKRDLMLVFGMFAYEGDPEVLRLMLASAPPPVRFLVPRIAPRVYARRARRVHGTPTP